MSGIVCVTESDGTMSVCVCIEQYSSGWCLVVADDRRMQMDGPIYGWTEDTLYYRRRSPVTRPQLAPVPIQLAVAIYIYSYSEKVLLPTQGCKTATVK